MKKRRALALLLVGVLMMQSGAALAAEIDISDSEDVTEEIVISDDVDEVFQPVEDVQEEQAEESAQAIKVEDSSAQASGKCGDNLTWILDNECILTISGKGAMVDFADSSAQPWSELRGSICEVKIQNGVTSIGDYAFDSCSRIENMTISSSVTSIGDYAFSGCSSLKNVAVPNSVTRIGDYAFYRCSDLTSVTIPNRVTSIGDYAFDMCSGLTRVTIPTSVTSLGKNAFFRCNLTSITVDSQNPNYSSLDGVLYNKNKTTLIQYPRRNNRTSFMIPNSVKIIGDDAFCTCSRLTNVTISDGVTRIGDYAFECCSSLKRVTISESVRSIGKGAFSLCNSLTDVYYMASQEKWNTISIGYYNQELKNAAIRYNHNHTWDSGMVTKAANCTETGIKIYTCPCGTTKTETIAKIEHTYKTTIITKAKPGSDGKSVSRCSCGAIERTSIIYAPKTMVLSRTSFTYSGKVKKIPTVTVKDSKGKVIPAENYGLSYSNGPSVGRYDMSVKFNNACPQYSGTLKAYFTINPKGTTLKTPIAGSKSFTAKWTKQSTQTSGYQLQYSTSRKFTNAKKVTITSNKTTSKKITKLSAKKKYYVRVRTYKTVSGKKYYSSWSSAKAVTTKK